LITIIDDICRVRQAQLLVPAGSVGGRAAMRGIPATRTGKEGDIYNAVLKESQCL